METTAGANSFNCMSDSAVVCQSQLKSYWSCTNDSTHHELLLLTHTLVQMEEALLKAEDDGCCSVECVTELRSLRHLDQIVDSAASSIVVVAFYSRVRRPHLFASMFEAYCFVSLVLPDYDGLLFPDQP